MRTVASFSTPRGANRKQLRTFCSLLTQKELDPDAVAFNSNNNRYHFPARFYLPARGTFGQIDPLNTHISLLSIGPSLVRKAVTSLLSPNANWTLLANELYRYAQSSPTQLVDPLGLAPYKSCFLKTYRTDGGAAKAAGGTINCTFACYCDDHLHADEMGIEELFRVPALGGIGTLSRSLSDRQKTCNAFVEDVKKRGKCPDPEDSKTCKHEKTSLLEKIVYWFNFPYEREYEMNRGAAEVVIENPEIAKITAVIALLTLLLFFTEGNPTVKKQLEDAIRQLEEVSRR
jgi:hypothetical protein